MLENANLLGTTIRGASGPSGALGVARLRPLRLHSSRQLQRGEKLRLNAHGWM